MTSDRSSTAERRERQRSVTVYSVGEALIYRAKQRRALTGDDHVQ